MKHTTRTTIMRPVASERLTGQLLPPGAGEQTEDPAPLVVPAAPSGSARSASSPETPAKPPGSSVSPQTPLPSAPLPVVRHFGSYEILGEISRGSFGVVYKARHQGLDRVVALKVLLAGTHASNEAVARFQREAKAVARLKHPHIVPVYDIGTHEGHHYFAMEFVEGHALSALIAQHEVTTQLALEIGEGLADALESAHRAGVIHRDIKPSNIIVDAQGQPHITDFGLAKQVDLDTKYTMSGTTLGTPAYMPPEQARGEIDRIDARSDVYAIGAVLYEMLTGRTPFVGRSLLEVVVAVINEPVKPPRQLNSRIHRDVQTIVLKCLEKDPRQRYASAAELRDDIRRFRSGEAIRAKPASILRHTTRFIKRHHLLVAATTAASLAVGFSIYRAHQFKEEKKEIVDDRNKLQKELNKVKEGQAPAWLPYWWFPPKDLNSLPSEEQRKQYAIPEGKGQTFKGLVKGKDVHDVQVQKVKTKDGFEVRCQPKRLAGAETLVSPEEMRFFGDVDAELCFTLTGWSPDRKLRVGLQSLAKGYDGIPYVAEFSGGSVRLLGPVDLYAYTSVADAEKKGAAALSLDPAKAEKDAPDLVNGRYTLRVHREGMRLSFRLAGPEGFPGITLEVKDANLSNWVFKNTQLVVRQPPPGLEIVSVEVKRRYGGEGGDAFSHFREGEYNVAEAELKTIAERGENRFQKARALYQLGLLQEICQPRSGRELGYYTDALTELEQLAPEETRNSECAGLATELRFRRLLRFARNRKWEAVTTELYRGWGQEGRIGEPLAWELHTALELALQAPPKDPAAKEADRSLAVQAAQALFERLGLTPGSARFGLSAVALAGELVAARRFNELPALYDAYPSSMLGKTFCDAIGRALEVDQFSSALALLAKMESRAETDAILKARATCDVLSAAMKARRYADVAGLYARQPSLQVLTILCKEIAAQAKELAADSPALNLFLIRVPPVVWANLPADPAASETFCAALDETGAKIVSGGKVSDLVKLHEALRGKRSQDPHLAARFAEAISIGLAAGESPAAEQQALKLLKYCALHLERDNAALHQAVASFAKRRVAAGEPRDYDLLIKLQQAYPTPQLLTLARDALLSLRRNGRHEEVISFFRQARVEFGTDARVLTPYAVAALENAGSTEERTELLSALWKVGADLEQRQLAVSARQWQMEYADIELVLNRWDKARDGYAALYAAKEVEPELQARAALRLAALHLARPGAGSAAEVLLPLLANTEVPEEFKVAARLLATPDRLRLEDLDSQLKTLSAPLRLSEAEWSLLRGLRLRLDGDLAAARDVLAGAAKSTDYSRTWVCSVASYLSRAPSRSPDDATKLEGGKAPEKLAPPRQSPAVPRAPATDR